METGQAYNIWASQYDSQSNKTRDLEAKAIREVLAKIEFDSCLEIGCGTGKNTLWLLDRVQKLTGVDLSREMIERAREKISSAKIEFIQADINGEWNFRDQLYDLVSFSLVLEHISNLDHVFQQVAKSLNPGGYVYIGELHPFKQYTGSKAKFETEKGLHVLPCFNHHISDFVQIPGSYGMRLVDVNEYFDEDDRSGIPRILSVLLRKL
ncbi:MAG: SAM-dependent methyltransferase [Bacteroidetes bacterium]|nr:MAG: SAM-dependent methyltransferase [Bacteroidota bacterium]